MIGHQQYPLKITGMDYMLVTTFKMATVKILESHFRHRSSEVYLTDTYCHCRIYACNATIVVHTNAISDTIMTPLPSSAAT